MEKNISYINRNFDDYRRELIDLTKQYYPDLADSFSDASIGSWLIDVNADVADNLSFHIDRVFQETNINSASKLSSLMSIARSNGFKVPGPKGAMAEVEFTCTLPVGKTNPDSSLENPNEEFAPTIKKGTLVSSGNQVFEVTYDIDFKKQFNVFGISDRVIIPVKDSQGNLAQYKIIKKAVVVAGETKIFKKKITYGDIKPFMEIILPVKDVMEIVSVIDKGGTSYVSQPTTGEFFMVNETDEKKPDTVRFFEVDSLSQQERWGDVSNSEGKSEILDYKYIDDDNKEIPACSITKGEWKPVKHKFITEYTDNGKLKIIFGSGVEDGNDNVDLSNGGASAFSKYQMTKMLRNNSLGFLPKPNSTLYIMYRTGGGKSSNVPKGSINNIVLLKSEIPEGSSLKLDTASAVKNSIKVTNTTPSLSGKDMPTPEELKNMIKYYNAAQGRCVTVKDYKSRIMQMPPEYGSPYRIGVIEENNKVMIYLLGIDHNGKLSTGLPELLVRNIENYLKEYRSINDFVEIKSGKIVNVGFDITIHTDKNYNASDVKDAVRNTVLDYMDVNKREMGDDIYVGDLLKEISKVDGVINLVSISAINYTDGDYSPTPIPQPVYEADGSVENGAKINLEYSENVLYSDGDGMLEVKYSKDINIIAKPI